MVLSGIVLPWVGCFDCSGVVDWSCLQICFTAAVNCFVKVSKSDSLWHSLVLDC